MKNIALPFHPLYARKKKAGPPPRQTIVNRDARKKEGDSANPFQRGTSRGAKMVMDLKDYIPDTQIIARQNVTAKGAWPVAIDYGYSSVKGFSPNKAFKYPNCAAKVKDDTMIGEPKKSDITLRDASGTWVVGEQAAALLADSGSINYEEDLFGRNRYFSPVFKAIIEAGIALGLKRNGVGGPGVGTRVSLQTGLPPRFREADSAVLRAALSGNYSFDMRAGFTPYEHYEFTIRPEDISIMDQPMGSLISCVTGTDGNTVRSQVGLLREKTLVFDPGFKTLDIFNIAAGIIEGTPQTYDNLGMLEVFTRAAEDIRKQYGTVLTVPQLQFAIRRGSVSVGDWRLGQTHDVPLDNIMEKTCRSVCMDAVSKMMASYDGLQNHDNLVITGGTGSVWLPIIADYFKNMRSIHIISANRNDQSLPNVFSNARGYYYFAVNRLRKEAKG